MSLPLMKEKKGFFLRKYVIRQNHKQSKYKVIEPRLNMYIGQPIPTQLETHSIGKHQPILYTVNNSMLYLQAEI